MSTKIYNGYVLPKLSLKDLHRLVAKMRERMCLIQDELYHNRVAANITALLDSFYVYPEEEFIKRVKEGYYEEFDLDTSPLFAVEMVIRERQKRIRDTRVRDSLYDFECNMVLIPGGKKIYMLFYAENNAYHEMLKTFPEIRPYPYWNNTDPPDDMTERQWSRRGKEWDWALSFGNGIPNMSGFTAELVHDMFMPELPKVLACIPPIEKRIKEYAEKFVIRRYMDEHNSGEDKEESTSGLMKLYRKAQDFLKTDEGKLQMQQEKDRLAGILKPAYTREDLFTRFNKIKKGDDCNVSNG